MLKGQIWAIHEHKLHSDDQRAAAEDKLGTYGYKTFLPPCIKGKKGGPSGGVGWIFHQWIPVVEVGQIINEPRVVSITLETPMLGQMTLVSLYGWVDDHDRTCNLVLRVIRRLMAIGQPWALLGDFNIRPVCER